MGGTKLKELIKAVRGAKTQQQERDIIAKEAAEIRTLISADKQEYRHRNVAKALYIHMLGYPTQWAQMECVKLVAKGTYADKRIGYLGCMLLLDEKQEILTLITHALKNDLMNENPYIVGLALCTAGNISSTSICRDLAPDIEKLLQSANPYVQKKAALAAVRVVRKCEDLAENFIPRIKGMITTKNHAVFGCALTLMLQLLATDPENALREFKEAEMAPLLIGNLKKLVMSGYSAEYDVNGITDPFLQVKILRVLRYLGKGNREVSENMNDVLAQIATNTDQTRNVGNAILYEAVQTIMGIESSSGLRLMAIGRLGRFLSHKDNNIRYVALNALTKIVSIDNNSVQKHRATIVECLQDPDVSIRFRALDLVSALMNEHNIKILAQNLLQFLPSNMSTPEFRAQLTPKLCFGVQRFAPSHQWHVDTIIKVMQLAGPYVQEAFGSHLIMIVSANADVQAYAAHQFYHALRQETDNNTLARVGCWIIGEFGDLLIEQSSNPEFKVPSEVEVIDLLDRIARNSLITNSTRTYVLNALLKLSSRFSESSIGAIQKTLKYFENHFDVEVQTRAIENLNLLPFSKGEILERIPVVERALENTLIAMGSDTTKNADPDLWDDPIGIETTNNNSGSKPNDLDILTSIFGGGNSSSSAPSSGPKADDIMGELFGSSTPSTAPAVAPSSSGLNLEDLLGGGSSAPAPAPAPVSTPSVSTLGPKTGTVVGINENGIQVSFAHQSPPNEPSVTLVQSNFLNTSSSAITNLDIKLAVPPWIKFALENSAIPQLAGNQSVIVRIKLQSADTTKPVVFKMRLAYQWNGQSIEKIADVNL